MIFLILFSSIPFLFFAERKKDASSSSKPAKEEPIQKENTKQSLPPVDEGKLEKRKLDSKTKPAKVGGFVSRFSQNIHKSEKDGEGEKRSENRNSDPKSAKGVSEFGNSERKVSKKRKKKQKRSEDFDGSKSKKKKGNLKVVNEEDVSEKLGEKDSVNVESSAKGRDESLEVDHNGLEIKAGVSNESRKRKENMVEDDLESLKKKKKSAKLRQRNNEQASDSVEDAILDHSASNTTKRDSHETASKVPNAREKTLHKKVNSKKKKSEIDKRSGVLAVKVVKQKNRNRKELNVEALQKSQDYSFGVGEGDGW